MFRSFLPLHNPIGFGASDFVFGAAAVLLAAVLFGGTYVKPYLVWLSQRTTLCMGALLLLVVLLRVALLPHSPTPIPSGADDFSYLLLGDTLAHFRLANAAHPLHQFFEAVFILQEPSYASIYPLGQGFVLAFGQLLFGNPWVGVLITGGLFCALCFWMLKAWVPTHWALLGGLLAVMALGPLSSWMNSYWGGYVSAIAGCFVFGALPRRNGWLLGLGLALQILTRPFEAVFLAIAALVYFRKPMPAVVPVLCALLLTLAHNKAVTHEWFIMPYMESRYQYGVPATFTFQPNAVPHRAMTAEQELDYRAQAAVHGPGIDSVGEYLRRLGERFQFLRSFIAPPLYFALAMCLLRVRERRYAWLAGTVVLFALGTNIYPYFYPQYVAALACVFILFCVKGAQLLPRSVLAATAGAFLFWFSIYASGDKDLLAASAFQSTDYVNWGDPQGRDEVQRKLQAAPGRQLVFVRYSPTHRFSEWIHNAADIDGAQIVWANDLGSEENKKLLSYYPQRKAWLLQPDARPVSLEPYNEEPAGSPFETVR